MVAMLTITSCRPAQSDRTTREHKIEHHLVAVRMSEDPRAFSRDDLSDSDMGCLSRHSLHALRTLRSGDGRISAVAPSLASLSLFSFVSTDADSIATRRPALSFREANLTAFTVLLDGENIARHIRVHIY